MLDLPPFSDYALSPPVLQTNAPNPPIRLSKSPALHVSFDLSSTALHYPGAAPGEPSVPMLAQQDSELMTLRGMPLAPPVPGM